ncbi:ribosome maturation factor RimP [Alkalicella caledoniensis]|uniref:Ribosome maturation factor RimP n=1 Tax=Alkalicella caledoniensis TaxID=2731377 RepID=A0A7G9WCP9_ALKCA|nr:ribosome maturation factor RimP [Alkalicella caledoniensis]QNO16461.1 ribosome maturation factor RimP [Alkalicella caledoniensis]
MKKEHLEKITLMAEKITKEHSLELVDVQFNKEGGAWFLRVYIDNLAGEVTTDLCAQINKLLSTYLDDLDPIEQQYFLEVSSPGIERPLRKPEDFSRFKGHLVRVNTYTKIGGRKVFVGTLDELENGILRIVDEDTEETVELQYDNVANVKLSINF